MFYKHKPKYLMAISSGSPQGARTLIFQRLPRWGIEQLSASTRRTSLVIGLVNSICLDRSSWPDVTNWTDLTIPSSLGKTFVMRANGHSHRCWLSFFTMTISFTEKLRFFRSHFILYCSVERNSLLHLVQNSWASCWTLLHCRRQYKLVDWNFPGGGMMIFVFWVNSIEGEIGCKLLTSLIVSVVKGLELMMPSTSTRYVRSDSSVNCPGWEIRIAVRTALADRICLSHTPPIWLAAGGLFFQISQSVPRFCRKNQILSWSNSQYDLIISDFEPTKFFPLSLQISRTFPLLARNRLKHSMKESVLRVVVVSMWTARLLRQVNIAPYRSTLRLLLPRQ